MFSCNLAWLIPCQTQTDPHGHFSVASPSAQPTSLGVWKSGYQDAWKYMVSAQDATSNFVLHRSVPVSVYSTHIDAIQGDEFMGGDDVLFGGLCVHTPCKVMEFDNFIGPPRQVEITLLW